MANNHSADNLLFELNKQGYTDEMVNEIWKWYDSSEKKGVGSY